MRPRWPPIQQVQCMHEKAKTLDSKCRSELSTPDQDSSALGRLEKMKLRLKSENTRKAANRKATRAELVAQQGTTRKKAQGQGQPLIIETMICKPITKLPTPVKCICYRSYE